MPGVTKGSQYDHRRHPSCCYTCPIFNRIWPQDGYFVNSLNNNANAVIVRRHCTNKCGPRA